jgi:hypothetical protein
MTKPLPTIDTRKDFMCQAKSLRLSAHRRLRLFNLSTEQE